MPREVQLKQLGIFVNNQYSFCKIKFFLTKCTCLEELVFLSLLLSLTLPFSYFLFFFSLPFLFPSPFFSLSPFSSLSSPFSPSFLLSLAPFYHPPKTLSLPSQPRGVNSHLSPNKFLTDATMHLWLKMYIGHIESVDMMGRNR